MTIQLAATYQTVWWVESCGACGEEVEVVCDARTNWKCGGICTDCGFIGDNYSPDENYREESGWTDPSNPYGGFKTDDPQFEEFDDVVEAAEFIRDWDYGGIWDLEIDAGEGATDYRTGKNTTVTLHVDRGDRADMVLEMADRLIQEKDKALKEMRNRWRAHQ